MPLILNRSAMLNRRRRFAQAQDYVDKQCLDRMRPLVPVALPKYPNAGKLRDSGRIEKRGHIIYSGRVITRAGRPRRLAKFAYYGKTNHKHGGNIHGRRRFFEVMKSQHKHEIGAGAAKIMGVKYRK